MKVSDTPDTKVTPIYDETKESLERLRRKVPKSRRKRPIINWNAKAKRL